MDSVKRTKEKRCRSWLHLTPVMVYVAAPGQFSSDVFISPAGSSKNRQALRGKNFEPTHSSSKCFTHSVERVCHRMRSPLKSTKRPNYILSNSYMHNFRSRCLNPHMRVVMFYRFEDTIFETLSFSLSLF